MKCINKNALGLIFVSFGVGIVFVIILPKWCCLFGGGFICYGLRLLND